MKSEFAIAVESAVLHLIMDNPSVSDELHRLKKGYKRGFATGYEAFEEVFELLEDEFIHADLIRDRNIRYVQDTLNLSDDYVCDNFERVLKEIAFDFINK